MYKILCCDFMNNMFLIKLEYGIILCYFFIQYIIQTK